MNTYVSLYCCCGFIYIFCTKNVLWPTNIVRVGMNEIPTTCLLLVTPRCTLHAALCVTQTYSMETGFYALTQKKNFFFFKRLHLNVVIRKLATKFNVKYIYKFVMIFP